MNDNKIIDMALKYQVFMKETSLFAEVEFSEKITKEMKLKIIGNKENNIIKKEIRNDTYISKFRNKQKRSLKNHALKCLPRSKEKSSSKNEDIKFEKLNFNINCCEDNINNILENNKCIIELNQLISYDMDSQKSYSNISRESIVKTKNDKKNEKD